MRASVHVGIRISCLPRPDVLVTYQDRRGLLRLEIAYVPENNRECPKDPLGYLSIIKMARVVPGDTVSSKNRRGWL